MAACYLYFENSTSNSCKLTGFTTVKQNFDSPEFDSFKILNLGLCFLIQIFGNPLCLAIWSYERFGGDPQKRTILNRLMGDLVRQAIYANMTSLATFMYRMTFGPISTLMTSATYYLTNQATTIATMFCLNEMAILKFLSIFAWKRLPPINEEFFGLFLMMLNQSVGFLFALYGRMGGSNDTEMFYILSGLPLLTNSSDPIFRYKKASTLMGMNLLWILMFQVLQWTSALDNWHPCHLRILPDLSQMS